MREILYIPISVLDEGDKEKLQEIMHDSSYKSNEVVDCLLEDQIRKLEQHQGERNGSE